MPIDIQFMRRLYISSKLLVYLSTHKYIFKNVPLDFDWILYRELNDDVKEHFHTEIQCKQHYETDGYIQDRRYSLPENEIPEDFDWKVYEMRNLNDGKIKITLRKYFSTSE